MANPTGAARSHKVPEQTFIKPSVVTTKPNVATRATKPKDISSHTKNETSSKAQIGGGGNPPIPEKPVKGNFAKKLAQLSAPPESPKTDHSQSFTPHHGSKIRALIEQLKMEHKDKNPEKPRITPPMKKR